MNPKPINATKPPIFAIELTIDGVTTIHRFKRRSEAIKAHHAACQAGIRSLFLGRLHS